MRSLPDFNPGAQIASGKKLRQMRGAVRELQQKPAYDYDNNHRWHVVAEGPGKIVAAGPNNETFPNGTAANETYFVQPAYIPGKNPAWVGPSDPDASGQHQFIKTWDPIKLTKNQLANPTIVVATNLWEIYTHSHALPLRFPVWIQAIWDRGTPSRLHWVMECEPPWRISVKGNFWTDSSALGGGVYRVRVMNAPTANFAKASGISLSTFGTEGTIDFLAANMQEQDQTTHDIDVTGSRKPSVFPARLLSIDDDEKTVAFAFDSDQWKNGC